MTKTDLLEVWLNSFQQVNTEVTLKQDQSNYILYFKYYTIYWFSNTDSALVSLFVVIFKETTVLGHKTQMFSLQMNKF